MPDIPTIFTSIGLTLAIQGLYFVYIKLPGQTRKNLAILDRLKNKNIAENRIFENVRKEAPVAYEEFIEWKQTLSTCLSSEEGKLIDRNYFRNALPRLTSRLGRLQGLLTSITSQYSTDPLPDFILLLNKHDEYQRP